MQLIIEACTKSDIWRQKFRDRAYSVRGGVGGAVLFRLRLGLIAFGITENCDPHMTGNWIF